MFSTLNSTKTLPVYLFGKNKGTRYITIPVCMSTEELLEKAREKVHEIHDFYPEIEEGDIIEPWLGIHFEYSLIGWNRISPTEADQRKYANWSEDDWGKSWI